MPPDEIGGGDGEMYDCGCDGCKASHIEHVGGVLSQIEQVGECECGLCECGLCECGSCECGVCVCGVCVCGVCECIGGRDGEIGGEAGGGNGSQILHPFETYTRKIRQCSAKFIINLLQEIKY